MSGSLILCQGRKSPIGTFMDQRSPQGRRSPIFLTHDRLRSPNELPIGGFDCRSPTAEKRSPVDRRSPTFSIHTQDRLSPSGMLESQRRSPTSTVHVQDNHYYGHDRSPDEPARTPTGNMSFKRTSITLFTPIPFGDARSPVTMMPIPPITVSNPSETCQIVEKMMAESKSPSNEKSSKHHEKSLELESEHDKDKEKEKDVPDKKEKTSVMREILAFVRKPSKRATTKTGRFAAAFSRAESGSSGGPLLRQSTFSCTPAAASTAAKSAVTKQMSEIGFESKMSLKFSLSNTKMSLKLRRSTGDKTKHVDKKSSGSEATASSSFNVMEINSKSSIATANASSDTEAAAAAGTLGEEVGKEIPFELANVHFEKVGESYIKHEQIQEEEEPFKDGAAFAIQKIVALSNENAQKCFRAETISEERDSIDTEKSQGTSTLESQDEDKRSLDISTAIKAIEEDENEQSKQDDNISLSIKLQPICQNLLEFHSDTDDTKQSSSDNIMPLQCPTFEIEPPSRRSSFDPPRSPYLEQLRSPGVDTDTELMNLHRGDSGGDSFELVDGDRNRESSFEDRYSSRDTSFDISRYQSTSYEDQTSSFELVDIDKNEDKKSNIDLRKSSIELVDAETFASRSMPSGRKSSLETHFDYTPTPQETSTPSTSKGCFPLSTSFVSKKYKSSRDFHILQYISRARSPLSNQTSSNYSSKDSYDSSSSYAPHSSYHTSTDYSTKQHFPLTLKKGPSEEIRTFLCTDPKCASIFEPRTSTSSPSSTTAFTTVCSGDSGSGNVIPQTSPRNIPPSLGATNQRSTLSSSEFEPPSPRRAASASPKHTFTFRIVLKKVDSSPDAICPSAERRSRERIDKHRRRDSRRKRLANQGKSF